MDSAIESSKSAKSQMKFRTVEEIDTEINRLERQQSTTSMKLAEVRTWVDTKKVLVGGAGAYICILSMLIHTGEEGGQGD